jgi:hypothetical protein
VNALFLHTPLSTRPRSRPKGKTHQHFLLAFAPKVDRSQTWCPTKFSLEIWIIVVVMATAAATIATITCCTNWCSLPVSWSISAAVFFNLINSQSVLTAPQATRAATMHAQETWRTSQSGSTLLQSAYSWPALHINNSEVLESLRLRIAGGTIEVVKNRPTFPFCALRFPDALHYQAASQSLIVQRGVDSPNIALREKLCLCL